MRATDFWTERISLRRDAILSASTGHDRRKEKMVRQHPFSRDGCPDTRSGDCTMILSEGGLEARRLSADVKISAGPGACTNPRAEKCAGHLHIGAMVCATIALEITIGILGVRRGTIEGKDPMRLPVNR